MTDSANHLAKTVGLHGHWGLSATFDFVEALMKVRSNEIMSEEPLRVLLVQPSDIRHIITTICRLHRHKNIPAMHFYLLESPTEILARDLLLLELFLDFQIPIRQRATLFLEVYGNMKLQKRTVLYLDSLASKLRVFMSKVMDESNEHILNFSLLKHRQRDELESSLKAYQKDTFSPFDTYYDTRKRALYTDRYDNRKAVQDWDYHANIKSKASIIHIKQYKEWRETGIAFQFGDQSYIEPNRGLMSYTEGVLKSGKEKGERKDVKGYWGDIVCSPYFAFGVDCETKEKLAEGLFEIYNKNTGTEQHRHHAVEVSLYSLFSLLFELEEGREYRMSRKNDIFSGLGKEKERAEEEKEERGEGEEDGVLVEVEGEGEVEGGESKEGKGESKEEVKKEEKKDESANRREEEMVESMERAEHIVSCLSRVKVFTMTGSIQEYLSKSKLKRHFDGIFLSCRAAEAMGREGFADMLKSPPGQGEKRCIVGVETAKFLVPLGREQQRRVREKVEEYGRDLGLSLLAEPPVPRRRRDEEDKEDDVLFFTT